MSITNNSVSNRFYKKNTLIKYIMAINKQYNNVEVLMMSKMNLLRQQIACKMVFVNNNKKKKYN